mgnify:CR=1 FL=1
MRSRFPSDPVDDRALDATLDTIRGLRVGGSPAGSVDSSDDTVRHSGGRLLGSAGRLADDEDGPSGRPGSERADIVLDRRDEVWTAETVNRVNMGSTSPPPTAVR